ncbi:MAG: DUF2461 domain-containing protein [Flavobacteriaceae bacterium]
MKNKIVPFLKKLEQNNNREWFTENKSSFLEAKDQANLLFDQWFQEMEAWDELDRLKKFRIYRDVRFSKNKTPYKTHFSASISRLKPQLRGGYYVEIKSDGVFLACGFWGPEKEDLFRIRKEIELDPVEFESVVTQKSIVDVWGNLQGDGVKTAPKGFAKDTEGIEFIRKKQFVYFKELDIEFINDTDFASSISNSFEAIKPFFDYMSAVLTTDLNGESLI